MMDPKNSRQRAFPSMLPIDEAAQANGAPRIPRSPSGCGWNPPHPGRLSCSSSPPQTARRGAGRGPVLTAQPFLAVLCSLRQLPLPPLEACPLLWALRRVVACRSDPRGSPQRRWESQGSRRRSGWLAHPQGLLRRPVSSAEDRARRHRYPSASPRLRRRQQARLPRPHPPRARPALRARLAESTSAQEAGFHPSGWAAPAAGTSATRTATARLLRWARSPRLWRRASRPARPPASSLRSCGGVSAAARGGRARHWRRVRAGAAHDAAHDALHGAEGLSRPARGAHLHRPSAEALRCGRREGCDRSARHHANKGPASGEQRRRGREERV